MKLDVSHVLETGLEVNVELDAREVDIADAEAELARNLQLRGRVLNAGEEMVLEGVLRGAFSLTCSRCSKRFVQPFDFEVSAVYVQTPESQPEARGERTSQDDTRINFLGDEIDLLSGIREDLLLNIPLKPLCRENCRGLCPQCGTDLNEGECTCQKETVDPRLVALRDIKTRLAKQVRK